MANKKSYHILVVVGFLFFLCSCKEKSNGPEILEVEAKNPATGVPISGINFKIYEIKTWGGFLGNNEKMESNLYHEGITDNNGYARFEFTPTYKDGKKYVDYWIVFDYSNMNVPPGDYEILRGYPQGAGSYLMSVNGYEFFDIQIVPKLNVVRHIKNLNCFDGNDKMRYKIRYPYTFNSGKWSGWIPNPETIEYYFGCVDKPILSNDVPQDSVYWEIEVTRNNIVTTIRDSMLLDPSKTQDTIKIYF